MSRSIVVTDIDIKAGRKWRAYLSPLALAMNRVFDEEIGVGMNTWWRKDSPFEEFFLPEEAIAFRRLFDDSEKVIPFMFEVNDE